MQRLPPEKGSVKPQIFGGGVGLADLGMAIGGGSVFVFHLLEPFKRGKNRRYHPRNYPR